MSEQINSLATLEYLGFTDSTAQTIWNTWLNAGRSAQNYNGFLSFANAHIENAGPDIGGTDADWVATMQAWGIREELVQAMMKPEFAGMRLSRSLKYWLYDTFEMRFDCVVNGRAPHTTTS